MCNERGGVIDDLYVYRLALAEYLLIINASRIEADVAWLKEQLHWQDGAAIVLVLSIILAVVSIPLIILGGS